MPNRKLPWQARVVLMYTAAWFCLLLSFGVFPLTAAAWMWPLFLLCALLVAVAQFKLVDAFLLRRTRKH